jgi:hypothetical protein
MAQKTQPLKAILAYPNKTIVQLCLQINQQLATLQRIKAALPKELANHALHCVFHDKKLLIYTDSAIWASQLRFYGKAILTAIESATPNHASILQVKVINVLTTADISKKRIAVIPSQTVADEIRNHSSMVTDPQLKKALVKLSLTLVRLQDSNN